MKEGELATELVKFGLTGQEADLFILLSKVRKANPKGSTGSALAELSGVNRVRTYQLLDSLVDLGIVQVEVGRPKRYVAENPQTAVRRLVALQESRLNELSKVEEAVADGLTDVAPIAPQGASSGRDEASRVAVFHGISTIQGLLRRAMQGKDLSVVVNDESEDHVFTTVRYLATKPKSVRVIFATLGEKVGPFEGGKVEIDGYRYRIRLVRGDLPTLVLNMDQCVMLFYESQRYRPKPLSPITVRTVVSSCVVIEGAKQVGQMGAAYDKLWTLAK